IVVELTGVRSTKTLVLRGSGASRLTGVTAALVAESVASASLAAGTHHAADVVSPAWLRTALDSYQPSGTLHILDGPAAADGLIGGPGVDIAKALMARGLHVLQEHPLHYDELADCLRTARKNKVTYHLNPFYTNTAPVRRYIGAVRELLRDRPPLYVDAACG